MQETGSIHYHVMLKLSEDELTEELLKQITLRYHERKNRSKAGLPTIVSIYKLLCEIDNRVLIRKIFLSRSQQISSSIPGPFFSLNFSNHDYSSDFQVKKYPPLV